MSKHLFTVEVRNRNGETETINVAADNKAEMYNELASRRLVALRVSENIVNRLLHRSSSGGVKPREISELFFQMATFLEAGLPLENLFTALAKQGGIQSRLTQILTQTHQEIRAGKNLSDSLAGHPHIFPRYITASLCAGEESGRLSASLFNAADIIDKQTKLKDTLVASLTYPVILLATAIASIFLIIYFAVPRFAEMFLDMGREMPIVLKIMSGVANHFWLTIFVILGSTVFLAIMIAAGFQKPELRGRVEDWLLGVPVIGDIIIHFQLALFFQVMAISLQSALPADRALELASLTLISTPVKDLFSKALKGIRRGEKFSTALSTAGWMPPIVTTLITLGEDSGSLDAMSSKIADLLGAELDKRLKRITSLAEPIMILGVGIIVGGIIISLLYSLFSINF